jgi:hypothetical protein
MQELGIALIILAAVLQIKVFWLLSTLNRKVMLENKDLWEAWTREALTAKQSYQGRLVQWETISFVLSAEKEEVPKEIYSLVLKIRRFMLLIVVVAMPAILIIMIRDAV